MIKKLLLVAATNKRLERIVSTNPLTPSLPVRRARWTKAHAELP